jgi:ParB-like chromosome segregation protein Spo0J
MAMQIKIENIIVREGRRPLDQLKVAEIAASFKLVGQIAPIGLRRMDNVLYDERSFERIKKLDLVFGEHRLEAAKTLGWKKIDAVEIPNRVLRPKCQQGFDDYAKLVEITENLHRAELTTMQRNEQIAAWVELYNQNKPPNSGSERPNSKPGPKPSLAIAALAKMSGLTTKTVQRAIKSTTVSPEVKAAADAAELTARQRLKISRLPDSEQLDAVAKEAADHTANPADVYGDAMRSVRSTIEAALSAFDGCDDAAEQHARLFAGLYSLLENLDRPARKPEAAA